jgi:hypothetical protein
VTTRQNPPVRLLEYRRCSVSPKTGDAAGAVFDEDAKGGGTIASLDCIADSHDPDGGHMDMDFAYDFIVKDVTERNPGAVIVGSRRTYCWAWLSSAGSKKGKPFPESLRAKVAAFFDAL